MPKTVKTINPSGTPAATALEELQKFPKLNGMRQGDIASLLKSQGFNSVSARSGGSVWTKSMPDGNTAVVRLDPPNTRSPSSFADSVEHAHKEIVPTSYVKEGNFGEAPVTRLNDDCKISSCKKETHMPTGDH